MVIKRMYPHRGEVFEVTRTSPDSATVNLQCRAHEHRDFIIGLMEDETWGWVLGRKGSGYPQEGGFADAVDHAANLLIEECGAMGQLDSFFSSGAPGALSRDRQG